MDVDLRDLVHIYIVFVCFGLYEANDQSCSGSDPVDCYECVSHGVNKICSDPFNKSHSGLRTAKCNGTCVKWVKKPRNGMARYIRTCSSSLQMRISVALVCMNESPPEDGKLCFCHRDRCNAADASIHRRRRHRLGRTIAVLLALLVPTLLLHCDNHALFAIVSDDDDMVRDTAFSDHKKTVSTTTTNCSNTRQRKSNDKILRIEYVITSRGRSQYQRTNSATSNSNITHQYQVESIDALIRQATGMKANTTATGRFGYTTTTAVASQ